jgi:hypothetical protein
MMPTDWIICKRDTPIYRLGCQVNPASIPVGIEIESSFTSHNSKSIGVRDVFVIGDSSKMPYSALNPKLKIQIDWSSMCWPDNPDVYNGKIFIHVNGLSTGTSLRVGDNLYICNVNQWTVEDSAPGVIKINTIFSLNDESSKPVLPPTEGISPECRMLVKDLRLDFDPIAIQRSLKDLEGRAEDQSKIMTLSSIIHANFINDKNIAICQLIKLADKLKIIQGVSSSDQLGLSAKRLIADFVEQASLKKFIDKPISIDAFEFFLKNENDLISQVGGLTCSKVSVPSLLPSKDPFIKDGIVINPEGIRNVETYEEARTKLEKLLIFAWSFLAVSDASIRSTEEVMWIPNLGIIANIAE